jgi:hypothetical protein
MKLTVIVILGTTFNLSIPKVVKCNSYERSNMNEAQDINYKDTDQPTLLEEATLKRNGIHKNLQSSSVKKG